MIKHGVYWTSRGVVFHQCLGLCLDEQSFQRNMKALNVPHPWPAWVSPQADASTHHLTRDAQHMSIVCLRESEEATPIDVACLLVHEAVHVFQQFCDIVGEHSPSSELEAYDIQHISQRLMEAYVELTGRR